MYNLSPPQTRIIKSAYGESVLKFWSYKTSINKISENSERKYRHRYHPNKRTSHWVVYKLFPIRDNR